MTVTNDKTPIDGSPYKLIPAQDILFCDEGQDAYQIESVAFVAEGVLGQFDVKLQEGEVYVTAFFGSENWGELIGSPVIIDDVRYSVVVRAAPISFADFDLASTAANLEFSMSNLDERLVRLGIDFGRPVGSAEPVFAETRRRFVASVARNIRDLAASYPGFANGFRKAVATNEIQRLRKQQEFAWREVSERTQAIQRYMAIVPEEMERVAPWTFSSKESSGLPILAETEGLSVEASGVHSVEVRLEIGATFVITQLVDGTVHTEVLRA
jgi:hypothetical protein